MLTVRDASGDPSVDIEGEIQFVDQPIQDKTNALIVGPTERGPAFVPKTLRNERDLKQIFGPGETYVTYAARKALEDTDRVKVQRVMHENGWTEDPLVMKADIDTITPASIKNQGSDVNSDEALLSVITFSGELKENIELSQTSVERVSDRAQPDLVEFKLLLKNGNGDILREFNISYDPASRRYIRTVFNQENDINLYLNFRDTHTDLFTLKNDLQVSAEVSHQKPPINHGSQIYRSARTPWIISQTIGGNERFRLFRFATRSPGNSENQRVKISINQIGDFREDSDYGFFTVQVRDFNDNDFNPNVLEEFEDVTLDPNHERFIGKIIGDKFTDIQNGKLVERGNYPNNSDFIRVILHPERDKAGVNALPYGFESYSSPFSKEFLDSSKFVQNVRYRNEQEIGRISDFVEITRPESGGQDFNQNIHLGFDFQREENFNWLNPVTDYFENCYSYDFNEEPPNDNCSAKRVELQNLTDQSSFHLEDAAKKTDYEPNSIEKRKFSLALQGGFDGADPFRKKAADSEITDSNVWGFDLSSTGNKDFQSYMKALNVISERIGGFDYSLLSLPGLNLNEHKEVLFEADALARDRGDFFHVADIGGFGVNESTAISTRFKFDTTYTGAYIGWSNVKTTDPFHDYVPASAILPALYVRSDNLDESWFAPSGYRRGVVEDVSDVNIRRDSDQRGELYDNDINVVSFFNPNQILVWGQKTLTQAETEFNRINIRRLLVTLKTDITNIADQFLFEQQSEEMKRSFEREIRNYLSDVRSNQGIKNYNLNLNFGSENPNPIEATSPYTVEGRMRIIPIGVVEYILVNFTVRENQISFEEQ